jgi:hypothetical protein
MAEREIIMKHIKLCESYWQPISLYRKANTKSKSQMALLGYMRTDGYLRDPVYGGAFRLLHTMEKYAGINIPVIKTETDKEIVDIVEKAMLGMWDEYAMTETEINREVRKLEHNPQGKEGK